MDRGYPVKSSDGKVVVYLRGAYNYDVDLASEEAAYLDPDGVSLTQQEFKDECDINEIVRRFGLTGQMPDDLRVPVSGDFTDITDFQSAMNAVKAAQEQFMLLPAEVRARFENDPQRLISFCEDGRNRDEAIALGLIPKPPEKTRDVVAAVDELAAKLVPPVVK